MNAARTELRWCLIIGYGNPLRGDDGLGHVAAQRLCELLGDESRRDDLCASAHARDERADQPGGLVDLSLMPAPAIRRATCDARTIEPAADVEHPRDA